MYNRNDVIQEIDTEILDTLIADNNVDIEVLHDLDLINMENFSYLFQHNILTSSELAAYFKVTTQAIRNRYRTILTKSILSSKGSKIKRRGVLLYKPEDVFKDIYEYEKFLIWRAEGRIERNEFFLSVKDASKISGVSARTIRRLIQRKKILAVPRRGQHMIYKPLFISYLGRECEKKKQQIEQIKKQMLRMEQFIHKEKNRKDADKPLHSVDT